MEIGADHRLFSGDIHRDVPREVAVADAAIDVSELPNLAALH